MDGVEEESAGGAAAAAASSAAAGSALPLPDSPMHLMQVQSGVEGWANEGFLGCRLSDLVSLKPLKHQLRWPASVPWHWCLSLNEVATPPCVRLPACLVACRCAAR